MRGDRPEIIKYTYKKCPLFQRQQQTSLFSCHPLPVVINVCGLNAPSLLLYAVRYKCNVSDNVTLVIIH